MRRLIKKIGACGCFISEEEAWRSLITQLPLPEEMNLPHFLYLLIQQNFDARQVNFPISQSDIEVVCNYASILGIPAFSPRKEWNRICYAISDFIKAYYLNLTTEQRYEGMVSLLQDLQEVFKVPKLNSPRNVQLSSFIRFLVKLLIGKPHFHLVITELQYFSTIFLDSPFQSTTENHHSEVQTLLSEFEILANEYGRLVYSFLFSPHPPPIKKIDEILSNPINLLKDNIIQFLNSPSYINTTPNTLHFAMSSVFIVDSFLYDLENLNSREDDSILEVKNDFAKLHRSLKHSWSLLNKQHNETEELKQIVMLAFEAEYLVNYFLCGDAPAWYLGLRLPHIIHSIELAGSRLQEMVSQNHDVGRLLQVGDDFGAGLSLQTAINSGMDETMVGFEDVENKILGDLVGSGKRLEIISIIGMPGIGKTTLAKKMYSHPTVRDRFDRISWCTVSQSYKRKKLLVEILTGLDSQVQEATLGGESEDEVGVCIHKTVKGRRYFIVVDDIWEFSPWEGIRKYFPDDGNGSRILLTSRNKEVADQCNSTIHELPLLSNDQCWELLQKKVFHGESCPHELQHTGAKVAAQCNGLPLVVLVVAGILSTMKNDLSAWENVRQNLDSYILSYQDRAVTKSLELSYMYLPHYLKPCFLYFGRFREDEQITVTEVVQHWIAEGFIPRVKRKRSEDIAKEYMKELIGKNLIMVAEKNYKGEAKVCRMHDLLRDMCLKIVEEDNFMTVADGDGSFCNHRVQRVICHSNRLFQTYSNNIRSLVYGGKRSLQLKVGHMKVLRVLRAGCCVSEIQNLVHLRYLWCSRYLPKPVERFARFPSLEFLILPHEDVHISSSFLDAMMKLRYLRAVNVRVNNNDWNTSRTYNNLEYISKLAISSQEDAEPQLKVFPHIRRLVYRLHVVPVKWVFILDLSLLIRLEFLTVKKRGRPLFFPSEKIVEITFPSSIIKLNLSGLGLSSEQMSIIGALPKLEVLKLKRVYIGEKWETRDDEFQKLKYLKLRYMVDLVEWNVPSSEHFPVLRHLIIDGCRKLEEIPSEIGCIPTLQLISVGGWDCTPQLKKSIKILKEQLQDEGNEDVTIEDHVRFFNSGEAEE